MNYEGIESDRHRNAMAEILSRTNDIAFWQAKQISQQFESPNFSGWFLGTMWIWGTPAPLIGLAIRGGRLLEVRL